MKHKDLPDRWQERLLAWLQVNRSDHRTQLSASDFSSSHYVSLSFEDGSEAKFEFAIFIEDPALREVAVFTEHCGYHIFPLGGTDVKKIAK